MTGPLKTIEVYSKTEAGEYKCVECAVRRPTEHQMIVHLAVVHGIRRVANLTDGGASQ